MEEIQARAIEVLMLLSDWIMPYLYQLVLAWLIVVLIVFGQDILKAIKKQTGHLHVVWRFMIFIGWGAFALTAGLQWGLPFIDKQLELVPEIWLFPSVFVAYMGIGLIAKKRGLL